MASTQEIRRRIKSVKNTRQITKAMEMVAASKMKRSQEANFQTRPYAKEALIILNNLQGRANMEIHPLLLSKEVKKVLVIAVGSDKGLCGGYNSQLNRTIMQFMKENSDKEIKVVTVGKRVEQFAKRAGQEIIATFNNFPTYPTSIDAAGVSKVALDGFISGEYDQVIVIYTHFENSLKQTPTVMPILPLSIAKAEKLLEEMAKEEIETDYEYLYEPGAREVLDFVLPRLTEMQFYHAILEAIASEQSARMMAMRSATDNASELIDDLNLTYNSVRQASITQELAEVSAGVEALK